jgi:hypothetical protein
MTDKKQVRGLLDYISLQPGEEAEYAPNSVDTIFGMGVGAAKDANYYIVMGYLYDQILKQKGAIEYPSPTPSSNATGRPRKPKILEIHQVRALHLWRKAQDYSEGIRQDLSNRHMIEQIKKSQPLVGKSKRLWTVGSDESLEQSVSRGKTWWGIDHEWQSDKCYKFFYGVYPEKKP